VAHHVIWGRGSHCGGRASGNEPLSRRARPGVASRRREARDLRRSPGPGGGHAATETDRRQPRQPTSEVPETNGSNGSGSNQLVLESIDTVGGRSSILRSPTLNPQILGGFSRFQTTVGPRCGHASVGWRWIGPVRAWPRTGRHNFSGSLDGAGARRRAIRPGNGAAGWVQPGVDHGEQRRVVAADRYGRRAVGHASTNGRSYGSPHPRSGEAAVHVDRASVACQNSIKPSTGGRSP
jgi:hypothetical protein